VTLRETISGTDRGALYAVVNGIDKTSGAGTVFIGKWSVLSLVHSFLKGGLGASPTRIRELPRVFITPFADNEVNQPTLDVDWVMTWKRWDNQDYTNDVAYDTFEEDTPTSHVLMYSDDNGANWLYAADNSTATPGTRPGVASGVWADQAATPDTTDFTYTWAGIGSLAEGSYLLRVEAYRDDFPLHYSYHQKRIFIKR
jgi:hypothetical protein